MQWSVLLPVVLTLIATHNSNNKIVDVLANLCYTKWALEAFVIANAKRFGLTIFLDRYVVIISCRYHSWSFFSIGFFLCFQIFWSVASNALWFAHEQWLRPQSLVWLFGLPHPYWNTKPRCCILLYGNLPKEVNSVNQSSFLFILSVHKW